jgi:hypothetical protein
MKSPVIRGAEVRLQHEAQHNVHSRHDLPKAATSTSAQRLTQQQRAGIARTMPTMSRGSSGSSRMTDVSSSFTVMSIYTKTTAKTHAEIGKLKREALEADK